MPSFIDPELLYLLVALPAFFAGRFRRNQKPVIVPQDRLAGLRRYQEYKNGR
jgi:hypothetical protein